MTKINEKAFTLIEIMIVITIILIITVIAIIPYWLYSNISKVKVSGDIILQTINEARNSSAWLINISDNKNQNIALFFQKWWNTIKIVGFPFDYSWSLNIIPNWILIREVHLESNINSNKFIDNGGGDFDNLIIYFKAPDWDMIIYKNSTQTWTLKNIIIWVNEASSSILSKTIEIK